MSSSELNREQTLFKDLDELYLRDRPKIIEWLNNTAVEFNGSYKNKISNLFNSAKMQINTRRVNGIYNIILKWFLNNKDKFTDAEELKLFDNIPSTKFTKISKAIMMKSNSSQAARSSSQAATYQTLDIKKAIKKWKENPNIDPYGGSKVKTSIVLGSKYTELYEKFITELTKDLTPADIAKPEIFKDIRKQLPKSHIYVSEEIDYIENLKQQYNNSEEDKWIDFLVKQKDIIYAKEQILDIKGYTVYDHLFMHFYLIKNEKHFKDYDIKETYIYNQEFLYETIENQIKLVKAVDMNCHEVIDSMLTFTSEENKGINFQVKRTTVLQDEWPYQVPPLLEFFTEYIYEISYYLMPIQTLNATIFNNYFLYGNKISRFDNKKKIEYIDNSINFNKYRLKTIINLIFGSMYNSDNTEKINIKTFLKILWTEVKDIIFEEQKYHTHKSLLNPTSNDKVLYFIITKTIGEAEIKNVKMFFVSSIFDIETVHKESQENNNVLYEPVIDPYNNLPEPPRMPRAPVISQDLQRYKMTSHIKGKNSAKEQELKEHLKKEKQFQKELKSYDKNLKNYNDKHLGKKLSPYFSVKLSRAKSVINNKNSLRLSYSPLKVSAKSLTKFKSQKQKELLAKFEKEPYSRTYKQKEIERERERRSVSGHTQNEINGINRVIERGEKERWERERDRWRENVQLLQERENEATANSELTNTRNSERQTERERRRARERERLEAIYRGQTRPTGGSKTELSKSDLKLKLALEANNPKFTKYAKSLSPSGKSPRQKYIGCDLNDNDPITLEKFSDMHFKKIKYLSKIKTTLPDGKIVTHCYDTIPFYNYILDCKNKGKEPLHLKIGRVPLTQEQKQEVFKKIKFFTKQSTLGENIESQQHNNVLYEPVIDPYSKLPEPPKMPKKPVISQELESYIETSHFKGKNSAKEKELKEYLEKEKQFKKKLKEYDKKLKEYNDKYLGKKLSPYFSVKLSRAKSEINNKNSLRLSYSPLKVSAKSLTKFKSQKQKELLAKFEKEPYSRTYKQKEIASQDIESSDEEIDEETLRIKRFQEAKRQRELERQRIERERQQIESERERLLEQGRAGTIRAQMELQGNRERETESARATERLRQELQRMGYWIPNGGGSKTKLSKSDLKLKLALEANNPKFKEFAKRLSPSGKSPRQKYIGCDLNDNDPITQETFGNLHFKKIKYLSKIKTTLPDGKIVTNCYDTIPFYNYILDCNYKGETPLNLAIGKVPLTLMQKTEVFKKIKFFTKQPTLEINIDITKKYFLKANYNPRRYSNGHYTIYDICAQINIGSIDFNIIVNNNSSLNLGRLQKILHEGPIISRDDILFEDTSDETVLLIQKGMDNGSLLKVNTYPYWNSNDSSEGNMPYGYKLLLLPPFTFSTRDSIQQLEERTKAFNNNLRLLI